MGVSTNTDTLWMFRSRTTNMDKKFSAIWFFLIFALVFHFSTGPMSAKAQDETCPFRAASTDKESHVAGCAGDDQNAAQSHSDCCKSCLCCSVVSLAATVDPGTSVLLDSAILKPFSAKAVLQLFTTDILHPPQLA